MASSSKGILFLTPHLPAFGGTGVRMRCGQHLEALSEIAPVHLILIDKRGPVALDSCEDELRNLTSSIRVLPPGHEYLERWAKYYECHSRVAVLKNLLNLPSQHAIAPSPDEAAVIAQELRSIDADVVFAFHLRAAIWLDGIERIVGRWVRAKIVDSDDIQWKMLLRTHRGIWRNSSPFTNILRIREICELWSAERKALKWDGLACCSQRDRRELAARSRRATVYAIPNTVRVPPRPLPVRPSDGFINLVFVGSLGYEPNTDAVAWFSQSIWPRIAATLGDNVRLFVVGREPTQSVRALHAPPQVIVTGTVPDLIPYYESADIVIAPIRFGGGTRIKIIEAWSYGRPVVSTTLGVEGLDMIAGEHALIGDSPAAFADAVIALATDADKRAGVGASGYALAERAYSQRVGNAAVREIIDNLLMRHA
jgi:glycosyltransferase involved in cell wall biosynthesis